MDVFPVYWRHIGGGWLCTWTDNFWVINRYTRTRNISHQNWQSPVDGNDLCDRHGAGRSPSPQLLSTPRVFLITVSHTKLHFTVPSVTSFHPSYYNPLRLTWRRKNPQDLEIALQQYRVSNSRIGTKKNRLSKTKPEQFLTLFVLRT